MKAIQELHQIFLASPKASTDSRKEVKDTLFFALSGDRFNGNLFAKEAIKKGARLAIIDDPAYDEKNGNYFVVDNVLDTLQKLALFHRESTKVTVIGITGSNGKTTTKELIARVLETEKEIVATQGNFNNHIGVPLTLLQISSKTKIAIVEMGANHPGEIATLCELARPNMGLITNIGKAHLEGMGSFEGVTKTKNELFQYLRTNNGSVFVNGDDPLLMELSNGMHRTTYGSTHCDIHATITQDKPYLALDINSSSQHEFIINTQLYGRYNSPNILAAITIGNYFKISNLHQKNAIEAYVPANSRSQQLNTTTNHLILDAYNANPVSMKVAIESFKTYADNNPWLILGDMFELGEDSCQEHENIVQLTQQLGFHQVIFVGENFKKSAKQTSSAHFNTTEEAYDHLVSKPIKSAQILIKGSRGMQLEKLIPAL